MRVALPIAIAAFLAALLVGCGGGSSSSSTGAGAGAPPGATSESCGGEGGEVQVTGVSCKEAKTVLADWRAAPGCAIAGGASHATCRIQGYLCIAARQGEMAAVSCALPGRSILFVPPSE